MTYEVWITSVHRHEFALGPKTQVCVCMSAPLMAVARMPTCVLDVHEIHYGM